MIAPPAAKNNRYRENAGKGNKKKAGDKARAFFMWLYHNDARGNG